MWIWGRDGDSARQGPWWAEGRSIRSPQSESRHVQGHRVSRNQDTGQCNGVGTWRVPTVRATPHTRVHVNTPQHFLTWVPSSPGLCLGSRWRGSRTGLDQGWEAEFPRAPRRRADVAGSAASPGLCTRASPQESSSYGISEHRAL